MKFRRTISAILSSSLILGCSFLMYPEISFFNQEPKKEVLLPATPSATSAPTPTKAPTNVPTKAPTPVPTRTPMLLQDQLYPPMESVRAAVTDYLQAYYKKDFTALSTLVTDFSLLNQEKISSEVANITGISDLSLQTKPGVNGIFNVVYASYTVQQKGIRQPISQFRELYIKRQKDGSMRVMSEPVDEKTANLLSAGRKTEQVLRLSVLSLIQKYYNYGLEGNEEQIKECVSDSVFLDTEFFERRYAYTESFSDFDVLLKPGINEFEYIAFITYKEKIVLIDTKAPCLEIYYISIDEKTGEPKIYLGITSLDTDAYCTSVMESPEIQSFAQTINDEMKKAIEADDDLREFYDYLLDNSED